MKRAVVASAQKISSLLRPFREGHTRRRLRLQPNSNAGVDVVLDLDYGELAPTPTEHAQHLDAALLEVMRLMQRADWPRAVGRLVVRTTYTALSPEGAGANNPVEQVMVVRDRVRSLFLPAMTAANLRQRFEVRSLLPAGWRVWIGEASNPKAPITHVASGGA